MTVAAIGRIGDPSAVAEGTTGIDRLLLAGVLTMTFLPKIGLAPDVYANVFDLLIVALFPAFLYFDKYLLALPSQRYLLAMWLLMAVLAGVFVLVGQGSYVGVFKIMKRIIYIPMIYVGYKLYNRTIIVTVLRVGCLSILCNIAIFIIYVWNFNFSLGLHWNESLVFGGLENRYFNIATGQLELIPFVGTHGVWGTYSALIFVFAVCARRLRLIGAAEFGFAAILTLFSIALTPSRESLLLISVFLFLAAIRAINLRRLSFGKDARLGLAFAALAVVAGVAFAGSLAIVAKLQYTVDSFQDTGTEGNIRLRVLLWRDSLAAMIDHPLFLIGGTGVLAPSFTAAVEGLDYGADQRRGISFGVAFESAPVDALGWGGIGALGLTIAWAVHLWRLSGACRHPLFIYFRPFLVGIFITNVFSGGSLFSDEVYAWFLLTLGFLYRLDHDDRLNHES